MTWTGRVAPARGRKPTRDSAAVSGLDYSLRNGTVIQARAFGEVSTRGRDGWLFVTW